MSVKSQQVTKPAGTKSTPTPSGGLTRVRGFAGNHTLMRKHRGPDGTVATADEVTAMPNAVNRPVLQRKCACGSNGDDCKACDEEKVGKLGRRMQMKTAISEAGDRYEHEADRISDQMLAAPTHRSVGVAPPQIQRVLGESSRSAGTAPASVDRVLSSPGRPIETALQQDMEHRFGRDFSAVRVHAGPAAELSAREINAHAYTVGHNIVFGAGQFSPGTHEGRRLIAHELTHVVQQSSANVGRRFRNNEARELSPAPVSISQGPALGIAAPHPTSQASRIQRKMRDETNLSVVKIVAFPGRKDSAEAHLSDGSFEPITLNHNSLQPGTYLYELDHTVSTHYRRSDEVKRPGAVQWNNKSIFKGEYQFAETVTVVILEGDPSTLRERIGALEASTQHFLTSDKVGVTSYADMERVALAGEILQSQGVTEDELLLREQARAEAEALGQPVAEADDPVAWALGVVEQRQEAGEQALKNRITIVDARSKLDTWSQDDRNGIKNVVDRNVSEDVLHYILRRHGMSYSAIIASFEVELKAMTTAFLSQAQAALLRIEKTYLANKNVGLEQERLKQTIEKIRPAVLERDIAAEKRDRIKSDLTTPVGLIKIATGSDPKLAEAEAEVKRKDEALQQQSAAAGLPVVSWKGFDWEAIRGGNVESSRSTLWQFVAHARAQIRSAQKKVEKLETLYKADRMVAMTKAAVGITKGSVFDDLITYRASTEKSDDGFWGTLWNIVTIALMFVPGNIGIALRLGAGVVDMTKALDEYAEGMSLYKSDLASSAPSSLGVFLAVGGTFIDVPSMGKGVVKVLESEATAGAKFGSRAATSVESTVGREAGETVVKAGDDVSEVASQAKKAVGGERAASANILRVETPHGVVYQAAGHEFKVVGKRVIRCSEPACSDAVEKLFHVYDDTIRKNPQLKNQLKQIDEALKNGDPDLAGRLSAQFEIDAQRLRGYKTDHVERLIAENESVITANPHLQDRLAKIDEAVQSGDSDLARRLSGEFEKDAQRLTGYEKPGSNLERGRFETGPPDPKLETTRPDIKEVNRPSRAGISDRTAEKARTELRRNMGPPPSAGRGDWQTQHIIPLELTEHPLVRKMQHEHGFNINGRNNGLHMPTRPGVPGAEGMAIHRGSHQRYTGWVESDLDQLYQAWKAGGVSEKDIRRKFEDVIGKFENVARESSFGVRILGGGGGVHLK